MPAPAPLSAGQSKATLRRKKKEDGDADPRRSLCMLQKALQVDPVLVRIRIANSKMSLVKFRHPNTFADPFEALDVDLLVHHAKHEGLSTPLLFFEDEFMEE